jgi:hypothetical protein
MIIQKASFVSLYCKIYTDSFSLDLINHYATGTQIYEFLMRSAGLCLDPSGSPRPGDCNLWYLGCCEKFGHMVLDDEVWEWGFGESSFDTVEAFVWKLYEKALTTEEEHKALMAKIEEGRQFDCMYQIGPYLDAKRRGVPWVKEPDHRSCREQVKSMVAGVKESLEQEGYVVRV